MERPVGGGQVVVSDMVVGRVVFESCLFRGSRVVVYAEGRPETGRCASVSVRPEDFVQPVVEGFECRGRCRPLDLQRLRKQSSRSCEQGEGKIRWTE